MPAAKSLLIVYHTLTQGTAQMAEAAASGARAQEPIEVVVKRAQDAGSEDLMRADGYLFATPENLAAMSGIMKDFFDRTYYPVLERINGRAYGLMICAGSDGRAAAAQIMRIATGWRLKLVADPLVICTQASTPERILAPKQLQVAELEKCHELGATLASGLLLGIF